MARWVTTGVCGRIALGVATLLLTLPCRGDDTPECRATLKGLTAVKVMVAPTSLDAQQDGLRGDDLQADVERRLHGAGIVVNPSAAVLLYVAVDTQRAGDSPRYVSHSRVELLQLVKLARDPAIAALVPTWSLARVEEVDASSLPSVRATVGDLMDQFINAFREQNPKP